MLRRHWTKIHTVEVDYRANNNGPWASVPSGSIIVPDFTSDDGDSTEEAPKAEDAKAAAGVAGSMYSKCWEHLDSMSEEDLDKPSRAPEEFGPLFGTVGACFAAMSTHVSFHAGQVSDSRRAAGRSPLMA